MAAARKENLKVKKRLACKKTMLHVQVRQTAEVEQPNSEAPQDGMAR